VNNLDITPAMTTRALKGQATPLADWSLISAQNLTIDPKRTASCASRKVAILAYIVISVLLR
jgi:hypothetical protein